LVEAALTTLMVAPTLPDSGNVADDLVTLMVELVAFAKTPLGRGVVRTIQLERHHPELLPVLRDLRERNRRAREAIILRAIERGELPAKTDYLLISDLLGGATMSRVLGHGEMVDEDWIRRAVSLLVASASAKASKASKTSKTS
jgi:hypothetical protein